jgi:hypothetical protein
MTKDLPVVQQSHEIQCIAKELELLKCTLPDKFVAGCIIAKLPPSWRNFATALKHKRREISVENLIASLDVEEKARAKDTTEKGEGHATALCAAERQILKQEQREFQALFQQACKDYNLPEEEAEQGQE